MLEVAAAAEVSLATVSNVLNRPEIVAEATCKRVMKVVQDLGYVRNGAAHQLRAGRSHAVGLIVLDLTNPFYVEIARGVEDAAQEAGLYMILGNSGGSPEREASYLRILAEQRVAGVLVAPRRRGLGAKELRRLQERGLHVVLLDRGVRGGTACSVDVDDAAGARLAADHLMSLGRREFAVVNGPHTLPQALSRMRGFRDALMSWNVPSERIAEFEMPAMTIEAGEMAARQLVQRVREPVAVFCTNDLLALGVLRECIKRRLQIPEQIAIIGYDDIVYAASAQVPLSSVRQPAYAIGRTGMQLLLEEVEASKNGHEHRHSNIVFKPELLIRSSTARDRGP